MAKLKLIMLLGPREGETLEYKPGFNVKIGRIVRGNTISIKDAGISSKHLSIHFDSGKWVLRDLNSFNGTILNDTQISADTPFDLRDGDSIKIGESTFIYVKIDFLEDSQLRRNPRRGGNNKAAESISQSRGWRGKVNVEKEEPEEGSVVEAEENRRGVQRRNARVVNAESMEKDQSESADQVEANPMRKVSSRVEAKPMRKVSSRRTLNARNEDCVVVSGSVNAVVDSQEAKVEAKRTRGGGRKRKNLLQEPMEIDTQEGLVVLEQSNSVKVTENDVGDSQNVNGIDLMMEEAKQAGNEGKDENGCVSGIKENSVGVDLVKMTLGDLFDYWEINLPKQIISETDKVIEGMREKATWVREYMIQQKNEMGKLVMA